MITAIDLHQGVSVRPSKEVNVSKAQSENCDDDKQNLLVCVCDDLDYAWLSVVAGG